MSVQTHIEQRGEHHQSVGVPSREEWEKIIDDLIEDGDAPLGVIGESTQRAVRKIQRSVTRSDKEAAYRRMMDRVDTAFKQRGDYLLWRIEVFNDIRGVVYDGFPREPTELVARMEALCNAAPAPAVMWSALYVLARLLSQKRGAKYPEEVKQRICGLLQRHSTYPAFSKAPFECAAIRICVLASLQHYEYQYNLHAGARRIGSIEENIRHFKLLEQTIERVDLSWQLGWKIDVEGIEQERTENGLEAGIQQRIAPCSTDDLLCAILNAVHAASASVRPRCLDDPKEIVRLQQRALEFAITAWQTARVAAVTRRATDGAKTISTWRVYELRNLQQVGRIARYAGKEAFAAAAAQAFLCLVDDAARQRMSASGRPMFDFLQLGKDLAGTVRQCGFLIDNRFAMKVAKYDVSEPQFLEEILQNKDKQSIEEDLMEEDIRVRTESGPSAEASPSDRPKLQASEGFWPPYRYRVLADVMELEDWKTILQDFRLPDFDPRIGWDPLAPINKVLAAAKHNNLWPAGLSLDQQEQCINAAHRLLIRYGQFDSAFKLLNRVPSTARLLELLDSVAQLCDRAPLAVHVGIHQQWRHVIRKTYRGGIEAATPEEAMRIHEALLGGTLGMRATAYATLGYSSRTAARALDEWTANSTEGTLSFLDKQLTTIIAPENRQWKGAAPTLGTTFEKRTERWKPIYVSVVRLTANGPPGRRFAIVATDGKKWRGPLVYTFEDLGGYKEQKEALFETSSNWLLPEEGVPWSKHGAQDLRGMFNEMLTLTSEFGESAEKWLLLNIDPRLAEVPWQELLSSCYKTEQIKLVSVVPGLRWLANRKQHRTRERPLFELRDFADTGLRDLGELVLKGKRSCNAARGAIIVGHGSFGSGNHDGVALPTVTSGNGKRLTAKDWQAVGQKELAVAHVCWGGGTKAHRLGDLGYLPGYLLGMQTNLVCAPVIEIPISTAEHFQIRINESLTKDSGEDFGEIYLDAISRDKNVAFYNLYGLANQKLVHGT
jgi:hypothetical protein